MVETFGACDVGSCEAAMPENRLGTHNCPSCEAPAKCDLELGKSVCWCFAYAQKRVLEEHTTCLCRGCMLKLKNT